MTDSGVTDKAQAGRPDELYQQIAQRVREIVPNAAVSVSSYDAGSNRLTVRAVAGLGAAMTTIMELIGRKPAGWEGQMTDKARSYLLPGKVHRVPGGLYEVLLRQVPPGIARFGERLCGFKEIYAAGLVADDRLLGSVTIGLRKAAGPDDIDRLQSVITEAALWLAGRPKQDV